MHKKEASTRDASFVHFVIPFGQFSNKFYEQLKGVYDLKMLISKILFILREELETLFKIKSCIIRGFIFPFMPTGIIYFLAGTVHAA